jgi:hypothetical protein
MGDSRGVYRDLVGKHEGDHLEDPSVDVRIILRWTFGNRDVRAWTGSGQGQMTGTCENGYETSGSIKCGEFLYWLRTD